MVNLLKTAKIAALCFEYDRGVQRFRCHILAGMHDERSLSERQAPIEMSPSEFRARGHETVDRIADFLASLSGRPVTRGESPRQVRALLDQGPLPERGAPAEGLLREAAE